MIIKDTEFKKNLDIQIKKHKVTLKDVIAYASYKQEAKLDQFSLNNYISDKYFKDSNYIIISDLTGLEFNRKSATTASQYLDLRGVDFSGTILNNTKFEAVDLRDAIFADTDLNNSYFKNSKLQNVDFRGSDLSDVEFDKGYRDYSKLGYSTERDFLAGIKFSSTSYMMRFYAGVKSDIVKKRERQNAIKTETVKLDDLYTKLSLGERSSVLLGYKSGKIEYDNLAERIEKIKSGELIVDLSVNKSLQNIISSQKSFFDPTYRRGASYQERMQKKLHVSLSRKQAESFIKNASKSKNLSLNDYAREVYIQKGKKLDMGVEIIADFSGKYDDNAIDKPTEDRWIRPDLSGLDFTGLDLRGVNFSGANLKGAIFDNADISGSNFESSLVSNVSFSNTKALDTNFFNADITESIINKSNFERAFMARSIIKGRMAIQDSSFDYATLKSSKWDGALSYGSSFDFANLESISLANAKIMETKLRHTMLACANLKGTNIMKSDITKSDIRGVDAQDTKWIDVDLEGAKVDIATNNLGAYIENVKGSVIDNDGNRISFEDHQIKQRNIARLKNAGIFGKISDRIFTSIAGGISKIGAVLLDNIPSSWVAGFFKPFKGKARFVGLAAGFITGASIALPISTAGLSLPLGIAVSSAVVAAAGAAGFAAGKKIGNTSLLPIIRDPKINKAAKQITGKTIGERAHGIIKRGVGRKVKKYSHYHGVSNAESQNIISEHEKALAYHKQGITDDTHDLFLAMNHAAAGNSQKQALPKKSNTADTKQKNTKQDQHHKPPISPEKIKQSKKTEANQRIR